MVPFWSSRGWDPVTNDFQLSDRVRIAAADDATAERNWLSIFDDTINRLGADVAGGRVIPVPENGTVVPGWFGSMYVKGFFGLDYSTCGYKEKVIPIKHPLYVQGFRSCHGSRPYIATQPVIDRADDSGFTARGLPHRFQQVSGGCFAVCACNAANGHPSGGMAVEP